MDKCTKKYGAGWVDFVLMRDSKVNQGPPLAVRRVVASRIRAYGSSVHHRAGGEG